VPLAVALVLALASSLASALTGYEAGHWSVVQWDVGSKASPDISITPFHIHVYAPKSCTSGCGDFLAKGLQKLPVLVFVTGFAATIDASYYSSVLTGVAAQGIVVVAVDKSSQLTVTTDYIGLAQKFVKVTAYITGTNGNSTGLLADLQANGAITQVTTSPIFFGAHSSGNHLTTQYVAGRGYNTLSCPDVAGFVMLSPLDGQDALGLGGADIILGNNKIPFVTPAVMISAQLDSSPAASTDIACASAELANAHFYNAWQGKIWQVWGVSMGHLDVLNEGTSSSYASFCVDSDSSASAGRDAYRNMVKGSMVSFIQSIWLGDVSYSSYLESTTYMGGDSVATMLGNAGSVRSSCKWLPYFDPMPYEIRLGLTLFAVTFALVFITGLCCFFRKMDEDTVSRYMPKDMAEVEGFQPFMQQQQPQYSAPKSARVDV
jgi:hypothetical protein